LLLERLRLSNNKPPITAAACFATIVPILCLMSSDLRSLFEMTNNKRKDLNPSNKMSSPNENENLEFLANCHRALARAVTRSIPGMPANDSFDELGACLLAGSNVHPNGYAAICVKGRGMMYAHRVSLIAATGVEHFGLQASHLCNNKSCFLASHLVWETAKDNHARKLSDGTHLRGKTRAVQTRGNIAERQSRFVGVHWKRAANKWTSKIAIEGRSRHLGSFVNPEDAARAYNLRAIELNSKISDPRAHWRLNDI
jgi:Zinc-binding loop region of homing endonuclease